MINKNAKIYIGFITYGKLTAKYLPYFLFSLKNQTYKDFKIIVVDNSEEEDNENKEFIKEKYPEIDFKWAGKNLGFAKAYNIMIRQAIELGAEYFLAINPDTVLEPTVLAELTDFMEKNDNLGSVSPKILFWDFTNNKKIKIIDTVGIVLKPGLRFIDLGQGEDDRGQYDRAEILGPSGAVAFYRLSAFKKIAVNGRYFDELMFMYKEDCDLVYRLFLAGFESAVASRALVYHHRTVLGEKDTSWHIALNRFNKSRQVKKWSFFNQLLIYFKYWRLQSWRDKLAIVWQLIKQTVFILLFEQYLLREFSRLLKIRKLIRYYGKT